MANQLNLEEAELEALMAELEASTGVVAEASVPEAPSIPTPPVVADEEAFAPDPDPVTTPEMVAKAAKLEADLAKARAKKTITASPDKLTIKIEAPDPEAVGSVEEAPAPTAYVAAPEEKPLPAFKAAAEPEEPKTAVANGLQFYVDSDEFAKDTRVTETNLDDCMIKQSSLRSFYGVQAAKAEAQAARMKARFEVVEAQLYDLHRKELATKGEKTTEKMVETCVLTDPRWLKMKNTVIEADSIFSINRALVFSLIDRKDMLVQLAYDRRDESKGQVRVLEKADLRNRALAAAS